MTMVAEHYAKCLSKDGTLNYKIIYDAGLTDENLIQEIEYRQKTEGDRLFCLFSTHTTEELRKLESLLHYYTVQNLINGYYMEQDSSGAWYLELVKGLDMYSTIEDAVEQAEHDGYVFIKELTIPNSHPDWHYYLEGYDNIQILLDSGLLREEN